MNLPWGRIAFVGASLGVHLAIVGAVLAVSRTEAPAPLPPIQVDVVQESSGDYRRAFAQTLPSIEARVASNTNGPRPSAPPSRARELAPVGEVHSVVDEALRVVSDLRPEVRLDPLPPCGRGLGRGACLDTMPPTRRPVVPAALPEVQTLARAVLAQIEPAPPVQHLHPSPAGEETVEAKNRQTTPSLPSPIKGEGALLGPATAARAAATELPRQTVRNTTSSGTRAQSAPTISAHRTAPDPDVFVDVRPANARGLPPRNRVHEIADRKVIAAIDPQVVAAIEPGALTVVDSAELKEVPPPRRKPIRAERQTPADKAPEPPDRKPLHPVAAVKLAPTTAPEPEPAPEEIREPERLATAEEVARVLKTLKPDPATEPFEALTVTTGARQDDKSATPSPDGAKDPRNAKTILAAALARGDAAQAANSAPAFRGAALGNTPPRYPYAARVRGIEGEVLLRVVVLPSGRAADVTLRTTSGSALLDRAARDAVKDWRFRPAKRSGQTVVGWVDVPVRFRLTD